MELLLHLQLPAHPPPGTAASPFCSRRPSPACFWNKGGWIQNRALTLPCGACSGQMVPMFANDSVFAADSGNNPQVNLVVSHRRARGGQHRRAGLHRLPRQEARREPYKQEVFGQGPRTSRRPWSAAPDTAYRWRSSRELTAAEIARWWPYKQLPATGTPWLRLRRRGEGRAVVIWLAKLATELSGWPGETSLAADTEQAHFPKQAHPSRGGSATARIPLFFSRESPLPFHFREVKCQLGAEMVNARFEMPVEGKMAG